MGIIVRRKENFVGTTREMERAFRNILNEIIEHVIEGICFEAHRAVKRGYFPAIDYMLNERKVEIFKELPEPVGDLFDNKNEVVFARCPRCNQQKAAISLGRHIKSCRSKPDDNSSWCNSGKTENCENNVDGNNLNGKTGNDAKRPVKSPPDYETMSPVQIKVFLLKYCGVLSSRNNLPCRNSLNCTKHSKDDRDNVRSVIYKSLADQLADGDIDIDTVD